MGFKMKGSAFKLNNVATKSAFKQEVRPNPNADVYARIIKEHGLTKNDKGFWVDSKGRGPGLYLAAEKSGVPIDIIAGEQREHEMEAVTSEKEE